MKKLFLCGCVAMALAACDAVDDGVTRRQCGPYAVQMTFDDNGDAMDAVINGDAVRLVNVVSASGARYNGTLHDVGVTLWGKGENWILILNDDELFECQ